MSGTIVQENQFINELTGQIQTQLTRKETTKSQYIGETGILFCCCDNKHFS